MYVKLFVVPSVLVGKLVTFSVWALRTQRQSCVFVILETETRGKRNLLLAIWRSVWNSVSFLPARQQGKSSMYKDLVTDI
jgi:hypothetical protein